MNTSALNVPASSWFGGSDGQWSAFYIQVSDFNRVNVLPASSSSAVWVVNGAQGCLQQPWGPQCATQRGGTITFPQYSASGFRWGNGNEADSMLPLKHHFDPEQALGEPYDGTYSYSAGEATVTLDPSGVDSVENERAITDQYIIVYSATTPYLGLLGLGHGDKEIGGKTMDSPLSWLASNGKKTSLTWGYTAGAYYRAEGYPGSLVFGGYDAARLDGDNVIPVTTTAQPTRDLVVNIDGITISSESSAPMSIPVSIPAFIDSVVPEIWLPPSCVRAFERAFGLVLDPTSGRYLINASQHHDLMSQDATIEFTLGAASPDRSRSIKIRLPYTAFYQPLSWPLTGLDNAVQLHYFPLRKAEYETQYTLGRVFLQEAYLAVSYDRGEFFLSQSQFPADQHETNIVAVQPSGSWIPEPIPEPSPPPSPSSHALGVGTIVGIVVGIVGGLALIAGMIWWLKFRKRSATQEKQPQGSEGSHSWHGHREWYAGDEKEDQYSSINVWAKHEMDADQTTRASTHNRSELPSPPPMSQHSASTPGSPGSTGSPPLSGHGRHSSGDYLSMPFRTESQSPGPEPFEIGGHYGTVRHSHLPAREPFEIGGHYGTVRRSAGPQSPVELSTDGEQQRVLLSSDENETA